MTTEVMITHNGPAHKDVLVEILNPKTGKIEGGGRLKAGDEGKYNVYDTRALRIVEIDPVSS